MDVVFKIRYTHSWKYYEMYKILGSIATGAHIPFQVVVNHVYNHVMSYLFALTVIMIIVWLLY